MLDISSVLSAVAATLAASLAGVNLVVSGRREHGRWAREALIEAFMEFMAASFVTGRACRVVLALRRSEPSSVEIPETRKRAEAAHDTQRATMTRLRLLASAEVVAAAESLHEREHGLVSLVMDSPSPPDDVAWAQGYARLWDARDRMIRAARKSMRLEATSDVLHGRPAGVARS